MKDKIAQLALAQLEKSEYEVHPDDREEAAFYAGDALSFMREESGLDPINHASTLARRAAIEYVKASITGMDPNLHEAFRAAFDRWRRRAQVAVHKERAALREPSNDDPRLTF